MPLIKPLLINDNFPTGAILIDDSTIDAREIEFNVDLADITLQVRLTAGLNDILNDGNIESFRFPYDEKDPKKGIKYKLVNIRRVGNKVVILSGSIFKGKGKLR